MHEHIWEYAYHMEGVTHIVRCTICGKEEEHFDSGQEE
jgi:hypothetical protein